MAETDHGPDRGIDRRTVLKRGLLAGGVLTGAGAAIAAAANSGDGSSTPEHHASGGLKETNTPAPQQARRPPAPARPNILVIVVDQLRFPQWFSPGSGAPRLPPNLQRLREGSVSFARHYTASNDCTPARATLLTGLYTHQTGCMITGGSTLDPGFPTWGTMLRELGYDTRWLGKWHLTHGDNHWSELTGELALERYGFAGGVYPSPDGAPGQGMRVDPEIAATFEEWFAEQSDSAPWSTTVSFVNPHDIAWWYKWSDRVPREATAPPTIARLPPNYETPEQLLERGKPRLQRSFQDTAAASFGPVPFSGPEATEIWLQFLDLYVKLQLAVDKNIGRVLRTLESRPHVAANTVILFTSDHGEYGASHGLRGKGASAYEEGIRVPLLVKDPRGVLTSETGRERTQMTSSVDIAPLLLTIASGSDDWRGEEHYSHIAGRADLASILADRGAPGREHILHATDETVTEFAIEPYAADAPLHIIGLRTQAAKYVTYSNWSADGVTPLGFGQETELYDYSTQKGRLEVHNSAGHNAIEAGLHAEHERAVFQELRAPLPRRLREAHRQGFSNYFAMARHAAANATARRKQRAEREEQAQEALPESTQLRHRPPPLPRGLRSLLRRTPGP